MFYKYESHINFGGNNEGMKEVNGMKKERERGRNKGRKKKGKRKQERGKNERKK